LRLALFDHPDGVDAAGPNTVVFDLDAGSAQVAPARVDGPALRWTLGEDEEPGAQLAGDVEAGAGWLLRCDRVDFDPGGVAYRHVHPGGGIRRLLFGAIAIDSLGRTEHHGPGDAWFERGPDPVLATTTDGGPSAFVRVMLVPAELAGQRTIRYVDAADADKPKTQRATVFLEEPVRA
jgi:hypothetical protein